MQFRSKNKIIVIVGPTASGKSDLAVDIAKKLKGEVISADSRQVYKGMDIGSGKITKTEMKGVPHHLLDIVSPKTIFTASSFQKKARIAIKKIQKKGKIPIICGGTGFYIKAVIDGISFPKVPPNKILRKKLSGKTVPELFKILKKLDLSRARIIDKHNRHRLIRSIEIAKELGKMPKVKTSPIDADVLFIGIKKNQETLKKLIKRRLEKRLKQGMLKEILRLHNPLSSRGISWKRLESFGLEYKYGALYLQKKIPKNEFFDELLKETYKYAKRQMTWFLKDKRINWVKNKKEALSRVRKFT